MNVSVLRQLVEDAEDAACDDPNVGFDSRTFRAIGELAGFVRDLGETTPVAVGVSELKPFDPTPTLDDVLGIAAFHNYSVTFRLEGDERG